MIASKRKLRSIMRKIEDGLLIVRQANTGNSCTLAIQEPQVVVEGADREIGKQIGWRARHEILADRPAIGSTPANDSPAILAGLPAVAGPWPYVDDRIDHSETSPIGSHDSTAASIALQTGTEQRVGTHECEWFDIELETGERALE